MNSKELIFKYEEKLSNIIESVETHDQASVALRCLEVSKNTLLSACERKYHEDSLVMLKRCLLYAERFFTRKFRLDE